MGTEGAGAGASKPMLDLPPGGASTLLLFLSPMPEKSSVVVANLRYRHSQSLASDVMEGKLRRADQVHVADVKALDG